MFKCKKVEVGVLKVNTFPKAYSLKKISNQIKASKGFLPNGIFTVNLRKCIV